jgi:hypothetical protein
VGLGLLVGLGLRVVVLVDGVEGSEVADEGVSLGDSVDLAAWRFLDLLGVVRMGVGPAVLEEMTLESLLRAASGPCPSPLPAAALTVKAVHRSASGRKAQTFQTRPQETLPSGAGRTRVARRRGAADPSGALTSVKGMRTMMPISGLDHESVFTGRAPRDAFNQRLLQVAHRGGRTVPVDLEPLCHDGSRPEDHLARLPGSVRWSVARLIHLNGPPGIGKSTIARQYVDDHPGVLNCDVDVLRSLVGGWESNFVEAGGLIRPAALAMITAYLANDRDVVLPQMLVDLGELQLFEAAAHSAGAEFVEVLLMDDRDAAMARFSRRGGEGPAVWHQQVRAIVEAGGGDNLLAEFHDALEMLATDRPNALVVKSVEGNVAETYHAVLAAVEGADV